MTAEKNCNDEKREKTKKLNYEICSLWAWNFGNFGGEIFN
jgi:hypothetical protein